MKVFLDASILVAAALSKKGGSFRILQESSIRGHELISSKFAYEEAERLFQEKYKNFSSDFYQLVPLFELVNESSKKATRNLLNIIDFKDAPVFAAALKSQADILLTLDRKHFLDNQALKRRYPIPLIMTPGDFIQKHFL